MSINTVDNLVGTQTSGPRTTSVTRQLAPREVEVLHLLSTGRPYKQIADELSIGEASVKSHVASILSKLGANDRTHAVTIGLRRGIIEL